MDMEEYKNILQNANYICADRTIPMSSSLIEEVKTVYEKGLLLEIDSQETPLMLATKWRYPHLLWGFIETAKETNTDLQTGGPLNLQKFLGYRNSSGETALHLAAASTNASISYYRVITVLLKEVSSEHLISYKDERGRTPISLLEFSGETYADNIFEIMEAAASKGDHKVDPRTTDDENEGLVRVYTEVKMDPNSHPTSHINETRESLKKLDDGKLELTENSSTILHLVSEFGDTDYAKEILKTHPSLIESRNDEGETPFYVAAREGHVDMLEILISYTKSDKIEELATRNKDRNTAMHIAIQKCHLGVVFWLVKRIPQLAAHVNDLNESPLYLAAYEEFFSGGELILKECKENANISYARPDGKTALHAAVLYGRITSLFIIGKDGTERYIQSLLQSNIGLLKIQDENSWTPLHWAVNFASVINESRYMLLNLLEERSEYIGSQMKTVDDIITTAFEIVDRNGKNVLHFAIQDGLYDIINLIFEDESLVSLINQKDRNGDTPLGLFMASMLEKDGIMDGCTPLHWAVKFGCSDQIRNLLKKRADYIGDGVFREAAIISSAFEVTDTNGRNMLHLALFNEQIDIVKLIFNDDESTSVINQKDKEGNTPLHLLMASDIEMKGIVIDAKFDIHAQNIKYRTPLDMASSKEKRKILKEGMEMLVRERSRRRLWEDLEKELMGNRTKQVFSRIGDNVVLVVTLIATATFAAAFTVPGGFDGDAGPDQGMPILLRKAAYKVFVMANAVAFSCSCTVLFGYIRLQLDEAGDDEKEGSMNIISLQYLLTGIAMVAMAVAFITGSYVILTPSLGLAISVCTVCLCIMVPLSTFPRKRLGFATAILRKLT